MVFLTRGRMAPGRSRDSGGEPDRQRVEAVDARDGSVLRLAVQLQLGDVLREEGESLLHLQAREVGSEAVVNARSEREGAGVGAVPEGGSGDVEAVGLHLRALV